MLNLSIPPYIRVMRPLQWIKNAVVAIPLFFAFLDINSKISFFDCVAKIVLVFIAFCFVSSSIYIINDVNDVDCDRIHKKKRNRPIASGELSIKVAIFESAVLLLCSLGIGIFIGKEFLCGLLLYFVLQLLYTFLLKRIVFIEVLSIALGFVLRVYFGALAVGVDVSYLLLICTLIVALILALCKRYCELTSLGKQASQHRRVLAKYNTRLLSILIWGLSFAFVCCFSIYVLTPQTIEKIGTNFTFITIPFLALGIFRSIYLTLCKGLGDSPERTLSHDIVIVVDVILFSIVSFLIIFLRG